MPAPLTWRTYRDAPTTAVPLLKARVAEVVDYTDEVVPPSAKVPTGPYERALGLLSGRALPAGAALNAADLRDEPYLLVLPDGAAAPEGVARRRLARPSDGVALPLGSSPYAMPVFDRGEGAVVVPGAAVQGDGHYMPVEATPLGNGCFKVPRGFPTLRTVLVGGVPFVGDVDYDPYHGVVYLEAPSTGAVLSDSAAVTVGLVRDTTWRVEIGELSEGAHAVYATGTSPDGGSVLGVVRVDRTVAWADARRLPEADPAVAAHTPDRGQFDGSPVSDGHLWVIKTDAPEPLVDEAVRRTLPVGTLYRVEPAGP